MMETMIPPQVGMRPRTKKRAIKKDKRPNKKMREKERRDNVTILLPHLCFRIAHVLHIESLLSYHFHILVGIFIIELGLYIPMTGFLKVPYVFMSKQVGSTPS